MVENIETKITDLSTDCLIAIFRYFKRDRIALCNIKLAHDAFGDAVDYFVQTSSEFNFVVTDRKGEISEDGKLFEGFVKLFGSKMKFLSIEFADEGDLLMNDRVEFLIENYCTDGNIRSCKLDGVKLSKSFAERNISFFNSLEYLKLEYLTEPIDIEWLIKLIGTSKNIKEIYITCGGCELKMGYDIFRSIASSNLEICHLNATAISDLTREMSDLPKNNTLKELNIGGSYYDPAVLTYFPNIECVRNFRRTKYPLNPILRLTALKTFELICDGLDTEVLSFLTNLADQNDLESFALIQHLVSDQTEIEAQLTNALCNMTNLKKLKLVRKFQFAHHLSRIGSCLQNLQEITFYYHNFCGCEERKKFVQNLVDFVRTLKNLTVIKCEFFDGFDVTELCRKLIDIREAQGNTEILHIHGIRRINWPVSFSWRQHQYIRFVKGKRLNQNRKNHVYASNFLFFFYRLKFTVDFYFVKTRIGIPHQTKQIVLLIVSAALLTIETICPLFG